MPYSRNIGDACTFVAQLVKNPGNWASVQLACADMVSSEMWYTAPWRFNGVVTDIGAGAIPLVDGTQDYSPPAQIWRLLSGKIVRTDVSPNEVRDIDVQDSMVVDLIPRSYQSINAISLEPAAGQLRLEAAVQVPSGTTMEIGGTFQLMHTKISALTTPLWFPDDYFDVFVAGLLYWGYKLADDPRAGGIINRRGSSLGSGQYAEFRAGLDRMKEAEDFGGDEQLFPSEAMGGKWASNSFLGVN